MNTLAEAKIKNNEVKKEKANKEDLLKKIKKMAGNSNRQVKETSLILVKLILIELVTM